jgi:hypothetical protein
VFDKLIEIQRSGHGRTSSRATPRPRCPEPHQAGSTTRSSGFAAGDTFLTGTPKSLPVVNFRRSGRSPRMIGMDVDAAGGGWEYMTLPLREAWVASGQSRSWEPYLDHLNAYGARGRELVDVVCGRPARDDLAAALRRRPADAGDDSSVSFLGWALLKRRRPASVG